MSAVRLTIGFDDDLGLLFLRVLEVLLLRGLLDFFRSGLFHSLSLSGNTLQVVLLLSEDSSVLLRGCWFCFLSDSGEWLLVFVLDLVFVGLIGAALGMLRHAFKKREERNGRIKVPAELSYQGDSVA